MQLLSHCESTRKRQTTLFVLWLPKAILFEGVMVCFTRASSCGPIGPPGGDGCRPKYGLFDSVGVTSDEINQLLE